MTKDIIDAEFTSVRPPGGQRTRAPIEVPDKSGQEDQISILAGWQIGPDREGPASTRLALPAVIILSFAILFTAAISLPGLFGYRNSSAGDGLQLTETAQDRRPERANVVTLSALIRNTSGREQTVPDVIATFRPNGTGPDLVYRIPRGERLEPGKALAFTVRMPKKAGYEEAPSLAFNPSGV